MRFLYFILVISALSACRDKEQTQTRTVADSNAVAMSADTNSVVPHVEPAGGWTEEFKVLKKALLDQDRKRVETFFDFPLNVDSASVWTAIEPSETELKAWKAGKTDTAQFDRKDFEKFYSRFFLPELLRGLKSMKAEERFSEGNWSSKEFKEAARPFQFHVSFDKDSQSLSLNVAFFGGEDEEGNYTSEGEYNIIYLFHWEEKGLTFDRMVIAG